MNKPVKLPDAGHPITIVSTKGRVIVRCGGKVVAETRRALTLKEASYPSVQYIPREDADMSLLSRVEHRTYCPYKGEASYYSLPDAPNAAWSYEAPHPAMVAIKEYLAFYPDRVDVIEQIR